MCECTKASPVTAVLRCIHLLNKVRCKSLVRAEGDHEGYKVQHGVDGTPQLVLASRRESKSGRGAKEGRDKRMCVLAQRGRYCTVCRYRNASPRWKEKGWMDVKGQRSWWTAPLLICLVRPPSASRPATLSESSLFLNSFERTERGYNIKRGHSIFQSSFPLPVRPCLPHTTTLPCASFQPFPGRLKGMDNVQIATGWSRVEG
jgi:hypothetical protein